MDCSKAKALPQIFMGNTAIFRLIYAFCARFLYTQEQSKNKVP